MRAVNLIPEELRPRIPGEGDPRVAYGVLGALAVLLVVVLISISYSNKLRTIQDQTAQVQAQINQSHSTVAAVAITPDTIGSALKDRTLLVGGLAKARFPWGNALGDLSKSIPSDTTLNSITATSGGAGTEGAPAVSPNLVLEGCTSGWVGYSRFLTWLKQMPGVITAKSNSSTLAGGEQTEKRTRNCGPVPLSFNATVTYGLRTIDLTGLPKPSGGGATGSTAATPAAGVPASAPAPAPAQVAGGGE